MFAIYIYEYVCESALYFKHNWHCPMLLLISSTQNKPGRVFNSVWHATFSEITLLHSHKFTVLFDNFFKENLMTASKSLFTFSKRRDLQWTVISNNNKKWKDQRIRYPKAPSNILVKSYSGHMQLIYRRTPMQKCFSTILKSGLYKKIHK